VIKPFLEGGHLTQSEFHSFGAVSRSHIVSHLSRDHARKDSILPGEERDIAKTLARCRRDLKTEPAAPEHTEFNTLLQGSVQVSRIFDGTYDGTYNVNASITSLDPGRQHQPGIWMAFAILRFNLARLPMHGDNPTIQVQIDIKFLDLTCRKHMT
jgi:hypothetical protein